MMTGFLPEERMPELIRRAEEWAAANPAAGKDALDLECIAIIRDMAGVPEGPIIPAAATRPVAGRERALRDAIDAVESLRDARTCGCGESRHCDGCLARAEDIAAIRALLGRPAW